MTIKKHGMENKTEVNSVTWKQKLMVYLMGCYVALQLFLPYSHFLTLVFVLI